MAVAMCLGFAANMNLIRTAKDDSAWTLSEEGYAELLKS